MGHFLAKIGPLPEDIMMKLIKRISLVLILVTLLLAVPTTALARSLHDDRIILGDNYVLESGEVQDGNLVIFGGNAVLGPGSRVNGDVVILGGSAVINGEVIGSVISLGGNGNLGETAVIHGDLIGLGGSFNRAAGARVLGEVHTERGFPFRFGVPEFRFPVLQDLVPSVEVTAQPFIRGFWLLTRSFLVAALAVLIVMLFPRPVERTAHAVQSQPLMSGVVGLLTTIVVPVALLVMVITILLIPVSLVGFLALVVLGFFGWVAVGVVVGRQMMKMFKQDWAPAVTAGVGTFVLSIVAWSFSEFIICVGWLVPWAIGMIGLGAVLITRIGSQYYASGSPAASA
jgi:hypothetical protein